MPESRDPDSVDAWLCATAGLDDNAIAAAADLLSNGERTRADLMHFPHDRRDYIAAHALVRSALAPCAGRAPHELLFEADRRGKPFLIEADGTRSRWSFSLTHTRGLVACVVAAGRAVGIDAEALDRQTDTDGVSARFFAPAERAHLQQLSGGARQERFFELWTLKESLLKATGLGLSFPLEQVAFDLDTGAIRLTSLEIDPAAWRFALFRAEEYCLAVATERQENRQNEVRIRQVPNPLQASESR